jgi:hypothetical protein
MTDVHQDGSFCNNCGLSFSGDNEFAKEDGIPCPSCGSKIKRLDLGITESFKLGEKLGMKARHATGDRPFLEQVSGADLCKKTGAWMELIRVIDREKDLYKETVTDPKTGEIIRQCEEPLSQHTNHGSAKKAKDKVNPAPPPP